MTFAQILSLILGAAEELVPIFIHNPKSQQIEGVIITTANGLVNTLNQSLAPSPVPVTSTSTTINTTSTTVS